MSEREREPDHAPENCRDLVGEMTNTISGNVREQFGAQFHITSPAVFEGGEHLTMPGPAETRTFVIPVLWENFRAYLVLAFGT